MKKLDCANCKSKDVCEDYSYNNQQVKEISKGKRIMCIAASLLALTSIILIIAGIFFIVAKSVHGVIPALLLSLILSLVIFSTTLWLDKIIIKIENEFYK